MIWCVTVCDIKRVLLQIPQSSEGKAWYSYVDPNVTATMLEGAVTLLNDDNISLSWLSC